MFKRIVIILFGLSYSISVFSHNKNEDLNPQKIKPPVNSPHADTIFYNGKIYTLEESLPWADFVAIKGNKIIKVGTNKNDMKALVGKNTWLFDLSKGFLMPGFIDSHTHFSSAGALINDANLLKISDDHNLRNEMLRVSRTLDKGEWITEGLWGAYEQWSLGAKDAKTGNKGKRWHPHRKTIDDLTMSNPVFVNSFDKKLYLANTLSLKMAKLDDKPIDGMEVDENNKPTGIIFAGSPAIAKIKKIITPKSATRLLNENRAALRRLRESGVVEIHDITSDAQMQRFVYLEKKGELTARIWMRADLSRAEEFNNKQIKMNTHPITGTRNHFLRWGAYKGYIDGIMGNHSALFFKPYDDQPDNYGRYRHQTSDHPQYLTPNMEKMYGYLREAQRGGFVANVHAIGTKGTALMLDTYERLQKDLGGHLDGYRVIHCQVVRPDDFPRFKQLNVIAEVNPYHLSDDMRWMEERIGHKRSKGAYAFKSLLDNGTTLVFGSDWPGTSNAEYHVHPRFLLHAAVNRTTIQDTPKGGWFPEQKIAMQEALKAYTINAAKATFDGDIKGSIKEGKLADLVVLDINPMDVNPQNILSIGVELTMVGGNVVFWRGR